MKTYFEEPEVKVIQFETKDVLTLSGIDWEDDELPGMP